MPEEQHVPVRGFNARETREALRKANLHFLRKWGNISAKRKSLPSPMIKTCCTHGMHVVASPVNSSFRARALQVVHRQRVRGLLTLAIETSCDDTSVAILEKHGAKTTASQGSTPARRATLHFHEKVTANNSQFRGIHPLVAAQSHQSTLANLVDTALKSLPLSSSYAHGATYTTPVRSESQKSIHKKPDFISVTRGPGMRSSLTTGLDTAKGLAVAFQVPLVAVNHMQAHALTPRLVSALEGKHGGAPVPEFPFMSLLVSGGHTMLVYSTSTNDHKILASTVDIAIGDFLDKIARDIVPPADLEAGGDIMYGRLLEKFVFSDGAGGRNYTAPAMPSRSHLKGRWGWKFAPPLHQEGAKASMKFSFSGLGSAVERCFRDRAKDVSLCERLDIGQEAMRVAFEHLASRVVAALGKLSYSIDPLNPISTLVVSGGVASNKFLKTVLRSFLDARGYSHVQIASPPPALCTDNAAMIAWVGMEMFEAGDKAAMSIASE
ncbi:hypothetical protein FGG08_003071 [Glutinoglossum americanum]|uniref:Gcp-like domain-containing protein n=1 Tax=Glutinoglossum americanum TaxID=1670608 RepID=A0A9P8I839_9PEZI|nr:hypothetical protein FGG08_003071 [Glutinoglossum americanum]